MNTQTQATSQQTGKRRRLSGLLIALVIVVGIALFALAAAGVGYLYLSTQYDKAEDAVDAGDCAKAMEIVSNLPPWFEDAPDLMVYTQAKLALQKGDYHNARTFFAQLGGFRDARELLQETDFKHAMALLESKQFDEAAELFANLARGGYEDADEMVLSVDYQRGLDMLERQLWSEAMSVFASLGNFRDSPDQVELAAHGILREAVNQYRLGKYEKASLGLDAIAEIPSLAEDVALYRLLIEAHGISISDGLTAYDRVKPIYDKLVELSGAEDSRELMLSDPFLFYYMEGYWVQANGYVYIDVSFDSVKNRWLIKQNFGWGIIQYYIDQDEHRLESSCLIDGLTDKSERIVPMPDGTITIQNVNIYGTVISYNYKRNDS